MATIYHIAHDPVSNSEAILNEYDQERINKAAESGIVFIAVDEQGSRSIVPASEVVEPDANSDQFIFVQPVYVDDRMKAVIDVFDALASSTPQELSAVSVMSADTGGTGTAFAEALAALKALVYGEED